MKRVYCTYPPSPLLLAPEPEFVIVEGAQESISRNGFRQPMYPGGPVRQIGLSYRPAMQHRLAESIPEFLKRLKLRALAYAQMFNDDISSDSSF